MIELRENTPTRNFSVGASIARPVAWILTGVISYAALTGPSTSDGRPQTAATGQNAPAPANETCLSRRDKDAFPPLQKAAPGSTPMVLKDRFLGSLHGQRMCVECHTNTTKLPHEKVIVKVIC